MTGSNVIKAQFVAELLDTTPDELDELEQALDDSEVMRYEAGPEFVEAVETVQELRDRADEWRAAAA